MDIINKNEEKALIKGTVCKNPVLEYVTREDEFYRIEVNVKRLSGDSDIVPVIVPKIKIDETADYVGMKISVLGRLKTHRKTREDGTRALLMYIQAKTVSIYEPFTDEEDINKVYFSGYLTKFYCRETSLNKLPIADVFISYHKDYYPCVLWGDNQKKLETYPYEKKPWRGRFQSREYGDGKIAYEIALIGMPN